VRTRRSSTTNAEKTKAGIHRRARKRTSAAFTWSKKRTVRIPLLEIFDLPENAVSCARRNVSTVAPQALTLLNSAFAVETAAAFAERVEAEAGCDATAQVECAFRRALQRRPDPEERDACIRLLQRRSSCRNSVAC
jgi:hypothetical protein